MILDSVVELLVRGRDAFHIVVGEDEVIFREHTNHPRKFMIERHADKHRPDFSA